MNKQLIAALAVFAGCGSVFTVDGQYTLNYYYPPSPSSTAWSPSWSPDGKSIAVSMMGSIWNVDPNTGVATELVYSKRYDSSPNWSPDGKWIVYTSDDNGKIQLAILNRASGESHLLTEGNGVFLDPVFSPDGRSIAYVSTQSGGHFNIYVRAIRDGRWTGEPVSLTRDNAYPRDRLYVGRWDMHTQPAWTPDGKEIVFVCNRGEALGSGSLWRMPVKPNGILEATPILKEQTLFRTRPDVSIDGKRVIYSSNSGGATAFNDLYVIPLAGGAPYKLTFGNFDHFHPRWSPSGEWIAFTSNEGGLPQLYLLETYGGARKKVEIKERRWIRPMGKLQVRIMDEATGKTTAARIHSIASDGKFYPPSNVYARVERSGEPCFHTAGEFTTEAPPGKMTIEALKGFEYLPAKADAEIRPGEVTRIELKLTRMTNTSARGWVSGTTHSHMNYGGNLRNTPENIIAIARAESLDIVMSLVANKDNRILDQEYFLPGGGEHPSSKGYPDVKIHVGEEYRPPFYGHVSFLGLKDHLISPFTTGYEGTAVESLYPSNTDLLRKARAQGALTVYLHPFSGKVDPLDTDLGHAKGLPVDAALGTVDSLEWSYINEVQMSVWHHLLNNDIVLPPVGGEDSITNLHRGKQVGSVRTYAHMNGPPAIAGWLEAVRKGRTYFSSGPILEFRVNGKLPGETIQQPAGGGTVTIEGTVWSIAPLTKVQLYSNGRVLKQIPFDSSAKRTIFRERIKVTESSWFSLYAEGPVDRMLDGEFPQAATNVIRVYTGDRKIRNRASAEYFVRWIDKLREQADAWLWWRSPAEKSHVLSQFGQAQDIYKKLAQEAP